MMPRPVCYVFSGLTNSVNAIRSGQWYRLVRNGFCGGLVAAVGITCVGYTPKMKYQKRAIRPYWKHGRISVYSGFTRNRARHFSV